MKNLIDSYGRIISYMRISVTDRCNMRCTYCMPADGVEFVDHDEILTYEEILRIVRLSNQLGVRKFRITGGEPLVRKGIVDLMRDINGHEGVETTFTTNALLLEDMAEDLKSAGVRRLNISLDSLNPERFKKITGSDRLSKVMAGIEKAYEIGFRPIKINVVVMTGINDDEIFDFIELMKYRPYNVRFIEFMPMKENKWGRTKYLSSEEIEAMVREKYPLESASDEKSSPSRNYLIDGFAGTLGFISPVSRHFCDSCNRIRLTSDGHIKSCLLKEGEVDLKAAMRRGAGDDIVRGLIRKAVMLKPMGHNIDEDNPASSTAPRSMSQIGG